MMRVMYLLILPRLARPGGTSRPLRDFGHRVQGTASDLVQRSAVKACSAGPQLVRMKRAGGGRRAATRPE
jgi:hypothetical protein